MTRVECSVAVGAADLYGLLGRRGSSSRRRLARLAHRARSAIAAMTVSAVTCHRDAVALRADLVRVLRLAGQRETA